MIKTARYISIFLLCMNVHGQETPDLYFNHLFFVLEPSDLAAISKSRFINDSLVVCKTKSTKADSQDSWTGTYLFGSSNYIEFFDNTDDENSPGRTGIGFSVDRIGDLNSLKKTMDQSYLTTTFQRQRDIDGKMVPWFDVLSINDSIFYAKSRFYFWIMEYKSEYFEYNNYIIDNNIELTRENYLKSFEPERKGKILIGFSAVVMKLDPDEKKFLTDFFDVVGYRRITENEYLLPDGFIFHIIDRPADDQNSIESIRFETSQEFLARKVIKVSDNIIITMEGNEGQIKFK